MRSLDSKDYAKDLRIKHIGVAYGGRLLNPVKALGVLIKEFRTKVGKHNVTTTKKAKTSLTVAEAPAQGCPTERAAVNNLVHCCLSYRVVYSTTQLLLQSFKIFLAL